MGEEITGNEHGEHDVCYVCISDMHLGEEDSLLTNIEGGNLDTSKPSEVMVKLVECLKEIIGKNVGSKKPTLILNGDILELALTKTNIAAMVFDRFLELILKKDGTLFDRIVYIPGNHDHHIWELARESQYADYICRHPNENLPSPWHKTPLCLPPLSDNNSSNGWGYIKPGETGDVTTDVEDKRIGSEFLDRLIERHSLSKYEGIKLDDRIRIEIAYPNLGLFSEDGKKCVLFHHGHFVEASYRFMSFLKASALGLERVMPLDVQVLESENFAWIDFFWSALGRSGDAGETTETLYEHAKNKEHMKKLTDDFARNLAKEPNLKIPIISALGNRSEEYFLKKFLEKCFCGEKGSMLEKYLEGEEIGKKTRGGLILYLRTAWNQIIEEKMGAAPSELTFVMGHTHKPFDMHLSGEEVDIPGLDSGVFVYNTGGWMVDEAHCNPKKGGSVFLLDKNLNHASICMYHESEEGEASAKKKVKVTSQKCKHNQFYEKIKSMVEEKEDTLCCLSNLIDYELEVRKEEMKCRLQGL